MKTKIIAITLVLSLMIMGVAYAAWGETVRTTPKILTGELDVDIATVSVATQGYEVLVTCDNTSTLNHRRFTIENMHPGASFFSILKFKNEGTIPTYVDLTKITSNLNNVHYTLEVLDPNGDSMRGASGKLFKLNPGQQKNVRVNFKAHLSNTESTLRENLDGANGYYYFTLEFDISQYNEHE